MPTLTVKMEDGEKQFTFLLGRSLRQLLEDVDVRLPTGCSGVGACGLCLVRIESGKVNSLEPIERIHLDDEQLAHGIRLACQVMPEHDLRIAVLSPSTKSAWRFLDREKEPKTRRSLTFPVSKRPLKNNKNYGVAVDLGTTNISLSLVDLANGQWMGGCHGRNPQTRFGSDVLSRTLRAVESPEQAQTMSQLAVEAIGEALWRLAIREKIDLRQVTLLALVGNTAMLALLSGKNFGLLLQPSHWMNPIDCLPDDSSDWTVTWGIHPQARIEVIPPLAGFVGSDLLAGVVTTNLTENGGGNLLVDFGTNSEIALWDGSVLWATSAAGGPAFEGSGMICGYPAEPGAIYRVNFRGGVFDYAVIGGGKPHGLCGSGIVDLIAGLVKSGQLNSMGKFAPTIPKDGFTVLTGEKNIVYCGADVDLFQRAKAAIGMGIQVLLDQAGMGYRDLRHLCVGGAFGYSLDIPNALAIGLLPAIQAERVRLCGNTALAGCEEALLSARILEKIKAIGNQAKIINLSQCADFESLYFENLFLRPMQDREQ